MGRRHPYKYCVYDVYGLYWQYITNLRHRFYDFVRHRASSRACRLFRKRSGAEIYRQVVVDGRTARRKHLRSVRFAMFGNVRQVEYQHTLVCVDRHIFSRFAAFVYGYLYFETLAARTFGHQHNRRNLWVRQKTNLQKMNRRTCD